MFERQSLVVYGVILGVGSGMIMLVTAAVLAMLMTLGPTRSQKCTIGCAEQVIVPVYNQEDDSCACVDTTGEIILLPEGDW